MTFSRPGIGKTNIATGNNLGNTPTVRLPSGPQRSPDAKLRLDEKAPQKAYSNELNRYREIKSFLSFFSDAVVPFVDKELDRQAKNELGKFIDDNPDALDPRNQSQELMDARTQLSPRAQNAAIDAQGLWASQNYQAVLRAEVSKPERVVALSKPGDDPETVKARATALNEAKAAAAAVFPNPYQRLKYAEQAGRAEASVSNEFYKKRINSVAEKSAQSQAQGFAGYISGTASIAEKASIQSEGGQTYTYDSMLTAIQSGVAEINTQNLGRPALRPIITGIELAIEKETDTKKQLELIETVRDVFDRNEILSADGLDIGRIADDKGITLLDYLESRKEEIKKDDDEESYNEALMKIARLQDQGRIQEAEEVRRNASFHNPEYFVRLKGAEVEGRRMPTIEMETNENSFRARVREGETWAQLMPEIETARAQGLVTQAFVARSGEAAITETRDPDYGRSAESKAARKQVMSTAGKDMLINGFYGPQGYFASLSKEDRDQIEKEQARVAAGKCSGIDIGTPFADNIKLQYELEVQGLLAEKIREKMDANEDWSPRELQAEVQKEYLAKRWAEANPPGSAPPSKQEQYIKFEGNAAKSIMSATQANGGNLTIPEIAIYGPTLEQWKSENPDKNFNDLRAADKQNLIIKSYENMEIFDKSKGETRRITRQEAEEKFDNLIKQIEKQIDEKGSTPGFTRTGLPNQAERIERMNERKKRFPNAPSDPNSPVYDTTGERFQQAGELIQGGIDNLKKANDFFNKKVLLPAVEWIFDQQDKAVESRFGTESEGDQSNAGDDVVEFFNSGGFGEKALEVAGGMLNIIAGASPATAGQLENATPESLNALREAWPRRNVSIETPPLPQVAAATPSRYIPNAITNDKHEMFVLIGIAEGTRTAGGGYTKAYYGHGDRGDGNFNRGTVSGGRNNNLSPQQIDRKWMGILTQRMTLAVPVLRALGLQPGTAGYNRMMFNILDMSVQSPLASEGFLRKLSQLRRQNFTVEAIAKARADSYFNPQTGRLEANGFNNDYKLLFKDQRSRAGVFDYRSRL